ncbi:hypothetical protein P5V15_011932 [Pogonomyrmex californicus]
MAERARSRNSLDEESQAGIISFVHRLPREIPLTETAEELVEASASAATATTPRSGNRRSLCILFALLLVLVPTYEQSKDRGSFDEPSERILNTRVLPYHRDACHQKVNYVTLHLQFPVFI